jgi:hypothetical protein
MIPKAEVSAEAADYVVRTRSKGARTTDQRRDPNTTKHRQHTETKAESHVAPL